MKKLMTTFCLALFALSLAGCAVEEPELPADVATDVMALEDDDRPPTCVERYLECVEDFGGSEYGQCECRRAYLLCTHRGPSPHCVAPAEP